MAQGLAMGLPYVPQNKPLGGLAAATLSNASTLDKSATLTKVGTLTGNGGTWTLTNDSTGHFVVTSAGELRVGLSTPDRGVATSHSITVRETVGVTTKDTTLTVSVTAITVATVTAAGSIRFPRRNGETAANALATSVGLYGLFGANVADGADGAIAFFFDVRRGSLVSASSDQDINSSPYVLGTASSTVGRSFACRYFPADASAASGTALKGRICFAGKDHGSVSNLGNYQLTDTDGTPTGSAVAGSFIRSAVIASDVPRLVVLRYTKAGATWNGAAVPARSHQVITIPLDTMAIEYGDIVTHAAWVGMGTSASKTPALSIGTFTSSTQTLPNYFPGKLSDFMYVAASGADTDWISIAKGVSPVTQFGNASVLYWWPLSSTSDLAQSAAATLQQTASSLSITGTLSNGQQMRPSTNAGAGLICISKGDGYVFGLTGAANTTANATSATITQSCFIVGAATQIQARVTRQADSATIIDWTRVSSGAVTGLQTFNIAGVPIGFDYTVELRREDDNTVVAVNRDRVRVGFKVALVGQSQDDITLFGSAGTGSGVAIPTVKNLSFGFHRPRNKKARAVDIGVLEVASDSANALLAMMERLGANVPSIPWMILNHSQAGESLGSFYADQVTYSVGNGGDGTYKMFGDYVTAGSGLITDLLLTGGKDIGFFLHMHGTADIGRYPTYTSLLNALYAGVSDGNEVFSNAPSNGGPTVTTSIVRNYAAAGLTWPIIVGMIPIQRHADVSTGAGASGAEHVTFTGQYQNMRANQLNWTPTAGITKLIACYTHDIRLDTSIDTAHQGITEVRGNQRINARYAMAMLQMAGLSTYNPSPVPLAATRATNVLTVTFTLTNGGSLFAPGAGAPVGFETSEDGGTTWHAWNEGGDALGATPGATTTAIFTAAVVGNTVTLTRKSGNWAANTRVRYMYGGPLSYFSVSQSAANRTTNFGFENTDNDNILYETRTDAAPTNGSGIVQGVPILPTFAVLVAA